MARILVAEDQITAQKMIEGILQSKGHSVTIVVSAHDALDSIKLYPYDLLITDVMMPGGVTGFELIKTIRADEKYSSLPILILTSRRDPRDIEKGIKAGTDDYVIKPVDPDMLIAKVDSLLKTKGKARSNQEFSAVAIVQPAQWDVSLNIVSVSEMGLTLKSGVPAHVGTKVKINSQLFDDIGITPPTLRVVKCEPVNDSNETLFLIETHFIALTEKALQPLRLWGRHQLIKKSS